MLKNNITIKDMAEKLGYNRYLLTEKITGVSPIYYHETIKIQTEFFKGKTLEYLFEELYKKGEFNNV